MLDGTGAPAPPACIWVPEVDQSAISIRSCSRLDHTPYLFLSYILFVFLHLALVAPTPLLPGMQEADRQSLTLLPCAVPPLPPSPAQAPLSCADRRLYSPHPFLSFSTMEPRNLVVRM